MLGRVARIALVVWVAALLVIPAAGYALGFRGKNIDNRTLAQGPGWSLHTLTHSSAWHHAADAFSDHMSLRDRAIRWCAETEFNLFHSMSLSCHDDGRIACTSAFVRRFEPRASR